MWIFVAQCLSLSTMPPLSIVWGMRNMQNTIKITTTKHHGLEVYRVYYNETLLHEYMSYAAAWTAMKRLETKFMRAKV